MPLQQVACDLRCERDLEILRGTKSLQTINGKPVAAFWKEADAKRVELDAWCKWVGALPPDEQVAAVAERLRDLNPGFDGTLTPRSENGVVTELMFLADDVTNLAPLRPARPQVPQLLRQPQGKGKLSDLSPLRSLGLTRLECHWTPVADLSPLKDLKLTHLGCGGTAVFDFTPLQGMPLIHLNVNATGLTDLAASKTSS